MRSQAALTIQATSNGVVHYFDFLGHSFRELHDQVAGMFGFAGVVLRYVDGEGDLITISSDSELEHAVTVVASLCLDVTPVVPIQQQLVPTGVLYPQLHPVQQVSAPPMQPNNAFYPQANAYVPPYAPTQSNDGMYGAPLVVYSPPSQVNMYAAPVPTIVIPRPGPFVSGNWFDYKRLCKAYKKTLPKEQRRAYWAEFKQEKLQAKEVRRQQKSMCAQSKEERKQIKAAYKQAKREQKAMKKASKKGCAASPLSAQPPLLLDGASVAASTNGANFVDVDMVSVKMGCVADKKAMKLAYKEQRKEAKIAHKADKEVRKAEKKADKEMRKAEKREARMA